MTAERNDTIFAIHNPTITKYLVKNMNVKEIQMRQLTSGNLEILLWLLNVDAQEKDIINIE
jgi:hypothetical protein